MSQIDEFFKDLPDADKREANIFEDPLKENLEKGDKTSEEEGDDKTESRKNRRERRLEDKLRRSEEMNIALNERVKVLAESRDSDSSKKTSSEVPAEWIALYGDTPEAKKAWDMNLVLINRARDEATTQAVEKFENKQKAIVEEQKKFEGLIDSELEALEDEHNVDLTSDAPAARKARREFLELVQKLSPKDSDGTIIGYADFDETFGIYQNSRKTEKSETTDRKKELAARSMTKGSGSGSSETQEGPMNWEAAKKAIRGMN